jgi:hypothetical protein
MAYLIDYGTYDYHLRVIKRVSGTEKNLGVLGRRNFIPTGISQLSPITISLAVSAQGVWQVWANAPGSAAPTPLATGQHADLATGGTLAKGKGGFYDSWTPAKVVPVLHRDYTDFSLTSADDPGVVIYSGKEAEWRSDSFLRKDSTGTYAGEPPNRGGRFYLQPGGSAGVKNRLVIALRRNDITQEADANVTDKHSIKVFATPRYLAPR